MSLNPLWTPTNISLYSSVFNVPPAQVCILYASGLQRWKFRTTPEEIRSAQTVCIRRLLHEFSAPDIIDRPCGWIFNLDSVRADKIVDLLVQTCGRPWQLDSCRNIGIIGIPGSYRLELNDATAIGEAQVHAELYDAKSIPLQVKDLFF